MAKPNDKDFYPTRRGDGLDNPLPCPDDLKKLEKILPGTADRVLRMAERAQQEHIEKARWNRFVSFFSGIESFILKAFSVITSFILKAFASILDIFKTLLEALKALSKETIRLLARVFAFILALATLAASVFTFIKATSNVDNVVGIAISIAVALGGALAGRSVYLKIGRLRLSSEKKSAGSAEADAPSESATSVDSDESSSKK